MRLPANRKAKNRDYLTIARKYRFIFLKSQYVKAPIRHLLYKRSNTCPNANDYPFMVPFFMTNSFHKKKFISHLNNSTRSGPSAPPSNFNPIPDMFIPMKYRDIIPKNPIYVDNQYVAPGSREWFTYLYNLDNSFYPSGRPAPCFNRKGKMVVQQSSIRYDGLGIYVDYFTVQKSQETLSDRIRMNALTKDATYHGTTPKHYTDRRNEIESLTHSTNSFHSYIPNYLELRQQKANQGLNQASLDKKLNKFLTNNNLRTQGSVHYRKHIPIEVSDDTATIEKRPNKRDHNSYENHYFSFLDHKTKKLRPTSDYNDDNSLMKVIL